MPVARHIVRAGMHTIGVAPDCTNDVELALSEAHTKLLAHGDPAVEYEVRLQLSDERCVLRVIEVGQGLERKLWAVPEPAELPEPTCWTGMPSMAASCR